MQLCIPREVVGLEISEAMTFTSCCSAHSNTKDGPIAASIDRLLTVGLLPPNTAFCYSECYETNLFYIHG
jgi:hypothetical protein